VCADGIADDGGGSPAGATVTYREIARRIGAPAAVRAVAQACASNTSRSRFPAIGWLRSDGALSGYRWSVERKRPL
jgi:AraC family transcriptional regulator, regulatory protein of adaptative response / methylated-DNA-[protein]-cysteine methyltransferase